MKTIFAILLFFSLNTFAGGILIVDGNGGGIKPTRSFGASFVNHLESECHDDLTSPLWIRFIESDRNEFRFQSAILQNDFPISINLLSLRHEELFTVHEDVDAVIAALNESKSNEGKWSKVVTNKKKKNK